jgi:DNA-binding NarL/FixJ family response regulator
MTKTILIADDHPFIAEGMEKAIKSVAGLRVIGKAFNGIEAIAVIKKFQPDCAVLDLSMPGANGMEVFLEAKRWSPNTKFIIVTGISAAVLFKQLYDAGIDGLFVKNAPAEQITDGILRVCAGYRVISDVAMAEIESVEAKKKLSNREVEVLNALSRGKNNREIAEALGLSPKTIDSHRTNLLRKMNVNSTAALLVKAIQTGILDVQ